jgi:hypothetical protein
MPQTHSLLLFSLFAQNGDRPRANDTDEPMVLGALNSDDCDFLIRRMST